MQFFQKYRVGTTTWAALLLAHIIAITAPDPFIDFKTKTALSDAMPRIEFEIDDISYEPQTLAT